MWLPWPRSPARIHTRPPPTTTTFDESPPPTPSQHPPPPASPLHKHSVSFKDIETLLNNNHSLPPPSSPLHKHSISFFTTPTRTPTRTHPHQPVSLKDIHSLLSDTPDPSPNPNPARKPSIFHRVRAWANRHAQQPPDGQNRVVVYYTSLRVIRKTFDDCKAVRSILKGYRVKIDERDLSMDGAYVGELQRITGKKADLISLPKVFINGRYLGGAEEIRRLHESGDLKRVIQGLPVAEVGVCGVCGGYRFVVCEHCDGSRRVYIDEIGGFKSCSKCNENGLIKCPSCTSVVF